MGVFVCGGANLQCSFGVAPSSLMVLPTNKTLTTMPYANIMDNVPFLNIMPFGMCNSIAKPAVASATASFNAYALHPGYTGSVGARLPNCPGGEYADAK